MTRTKVQARLRKIRARLAELSRAERFRLGRTRYWKTIYNRRKKRLGEGHEKTRWALHKYRTSRALGWKINHTQAVLHRRAENKLAWLRKHPPSIDPDRDGLVMMDGRQVARGVAVELRKARAHGWGGQVFSGYRTPAYSESLCYGICGAPSCPGMCAGRSTNHARKPPENSERAGAADCSDYFTLKRVLAEIDSWLENHLPRDLPHFSDSGN